MSDTLESILAKPIGVSVLPQYQGWQELAQAQAQTGLTQQQAQGAAIGNQLQNLNLQRTNYLYGLAGVPGVGGNSTGVAQPNVLTPLGFSPAGAPAANAPGAAQSETAQPWPGAAAYARYGVPLDPLTYAQVSTAADPTKAKAEAFEARRQAVYASASVPPQQFQASMANLYRSGQITPQTMQYVMTNPDDAQARMLQTYKDPESHATAMATLTNAGLGADANSPSGVSPSSAAATAKGNVAGAEAGAKANVDLATAGPIEAAKEGAKAPYGNWQEMTVADGQGNLHVEYVSPQQRAAMSGGARPTTAADMANPAVSITPAAFAGRVGQTESGNNPAQGQSATSSASGSAQFLPSTFVPIARQIAPQQTQGMSDAQVAALRNDTSPQGQALIQQATQAYAQQNAGVLQAAGAPVTSATLGLAHRFGGQGAVSVLNAPANAPISSVVSPQVMAANPDLKGMTVGGVLGKAYGQYGVNPVSFGQDAVAPGGAAPIVPGAIPGKPVLTPQQQAALDVSKATQTASNTSDITAMQSYRTDTAKAAQTAQQNNAVLDQMRQEGQSFDHGNFTDTWQRIQKLGGSVSQALGGTMPANVGDWEAFNKNAGQLARTAASGLSSRVGVQELQLVQKYLPSDTMSSQAFSRVADQLQGINDYQVARNAAAANFKGNPSQFEANFNKNVTPGVFIVNRMSQADANALSMNLQKTPEGRRVWQGIMAGHDYAKANGLMDAIMPGQGQ